MQLQRNTKTSCVTMAEAEAEKSMQNVRKSGKKQMLDATIICLSYRYVFMYACMYVLDVERFIIIKSSNVKRRD